MRTQQKVTYSLFAIAILFGAIAFCNLGKAVGQDIFQGFELIRKALVPGFIAGITLAAATFSLRNS